MTRLGGRELAILFTVIVVVSMVGPSTVVATDYDDEQFVEASDNVSVWDRAAFAPLYVDYGSGDAETNIQHPEPSLWTDDPDIGEAGLNRYRTGVWGTNQTIELHFEDRAASTSNITKFDGNTWDLVVARTDVNSLNLSGSDSNGDALFTTDRALDLLDEDTDADVEIAETREFNGTETFTYDPSEPGAYAFVLVDNGSVDVDNGDVTNVTDAHVVGMDTTIVQDARGSIDPDPGAHRAGDNITFDVSANVPNPAEHITHTVVLYNESDVLYREGSDTENVRFVFNGTAEDLADAEASDVTLETSYGAVDGVFRTEGDVDAFGLDVDEEDTVGTFGVQTIADAFLPDVGLDGVAIDGGDTVLNASVTAVNTTASDTEIQVGTTENFTAGTYDVLYVAESRDSGQLSTRRRQIEIKRAVPPSPGPPGFAPGSGGGGGDGPPFDPGQGNGPPIDVQQSQNGAKVSFENARTDVRSIVALPDTVGTERAAVESIAINTTTNHPGLGLSIQASDAIPDSDTPDLDLGDAISYVEVTVDAESAVEYDGTEFKFTVPNATLEERAIDREDVRLYRFDEAADEWQQLPTEHVGGETHAATSPGFSVFAIGAAQQSDVQIRDVVVNPAKTEVGEPVEVTATAENTGDEPGTFTVDLAVDGGVVDSTNVTLDPGETEDVAFEQTFDEAGQYDLSIGGQDAGTVEVTNDRSGGGPFEVDFIGPGVAVIVLLVLIVLGIGGVYYLRSSDRVELGR